MSSNTPTHHSHRAFGLTFRSELPLPELPAVEAGDGADVEILRGEVRPGVEFDERGMAFWIARDAAGLGYAYRGVASFIVEAGVRITVCIEPGVEEHIARLSLLGPALGLLLHQRGFHVLHASTVAHEGEAVAFVGAGGWGKSTTAALLQSVGWELVSDDVTALCVPNARGGGSESRVLAQPGFPQIKLWPDAAAAAGEDADTLPRLHPDFEKRALRSSAAFASEPRPVRRIYSLGFGDRLAIESASVQQGFAELAHHFYGARFGPQFLRTLSTETILLRSAAILREAPVQRLLRPGTPLTQPRETARAIADLIIADLAG